MTKVELINKVSRSLKSEGVTKRDIDLVINETFIIIADSLINGEPVKIKHFGNFDIKETAARLARNPRKNTPVEVPAGYKAIWKPSNWIKDAVNELV